MDKMTHTYDAIYENGVFRPLHEPTLTEGQPVQLIVTPKAPNAADVVELAGRVLDGLSEHEIAEFERVSLRRESFFGDRN